MSTKTEFYFDSLDGKTKLHGIMWKPEGKVKAILQISHGMVEFVDRYDDFAQYLSRNGFLVVGHDHLGHGESIVNKEAYGFFAKDRPNETVIGDLYKLTQYVKQEYRDTPYFLLGHSMGSFYARQYLCEHGKALDGAIIMGTGNKPKILADAGRMMTVMTAKSRGWHYRSKLIDQMAFGGYNKRFEPARTEKDWLTKDEEKVDAYLGDERCTFSIKVNGYNSIITGLSKLDSKS